MDNGEADKKSFWTYFKQKKIFRFQAIHVYICNGNQNL